MLTAAQLDELLSGGSPADLSSNLHTYLATLPESDKENLVVLAEMNTATRLAELVVTADATGDESKAVFARLALLLNRVQADADIAREQAAVAAKHAAPVKYELPLVSLAGQPALYEVCAKLQKGAILKLTKTSAWAVLGQKPSEHIYPTDETVEQLRAGGFVVPAPGQSWAEPKELLLSAIGWRSMGCMFRDRTSETELQVYAIAGTPTDTDRAKRFRSITADWRARQARRDTSPGWNRWSEFDVTIPDKVTGDGIKTVVVVFCAGRQHEPKDQADSFEFFGDVSDSGYRQHTQPQGATIAATVSQRAYELACGMCGKRASDKRSEAARNPKPKQKPVPPPVKVLDEHEDPTVLAEMLGII